MSPEAQRIAIAEACGITRLWSTAMPVRTVHCDVPDYLNDLNAMAEAEKTLTDVELEDFAFQLGYDDDVFPAKNIRLLLRATAAQRAEAFLKTLGKWTDDK
jgi:hypothetical protein